MKWHFLIAWQLISNTFFQLKWLNFQVDSQVDLEGTLSVYFLAFFSYKYL